MSRCITSSCLTFEEVVDKSEAGMVTVMLSVLVLGDQRSTVIGHRDVVMRVVDGLEGVVAGVEFVFNEEEWGVVVENVRVARSGLVLQMQVVVVVADEPSRTCWIDDRYTELVLALASSHSTQAATSYEQD